jgi:hypothetical protein
MGFISQLHEAPYFLGVFRPLVETRLIRPPGRSSVGIFG